MRFSKDTVVGVVGAGAMGSGIAQVAAVAGHKVILYDTNHAALEKSKANLATTIKKLEEKGKLQNGQAIIDSFTYATELDAFAECGLVIEAIIENLEVKKKLFGAIEQIVKSGCVLASNTSSLSITSIAAACHKAERVIGLHFFNPAPLMALVEVIPAVQTEAALVDESKQLMQDWGKVPVIAKDTPGFIVNRVARPFYGEAIRIYEEGIADIPTIDWAMTEIGDRKSVV